MGGSGDGGHDCNRPRCGKRHVCIVLRDGALRAEHARTQTAKCQDDSLASGGNGNGNGNAA
jgi:hypothetical protein